MLLTLSDVLEVKNVMIGHFLLGSSLVSNKYTDARLYAGLSTLAMVVRAIIYRWKGNA